MASSYARVLRRAFREVPYYREQAAAAGRMLAAPAVLPAERLDEVAHQLFPLGEPLGSAWQPDPRELYESLLLTEVYAASTTVFEIRPAVLDWARLGPVRKGRYRTILSADAIVDPHGASRAELLRRSVEEFAATPRRTLLGRAEDVATFLGAVAAAGARDAAERSTVVLVRAVAEAARVLRGSDPSPALLRDAYLGCLGAWVRSCGQLHVAPRVHPHRAEQGLVFTKLQQRRPTLVHVQPIGAEQLDLGTCPRHSTAVLLAGA